MVVPEYDYFRFTVMSIFDLTVDLPLQPRCQAPADVKAYLDRHSLGPPGTSGEAPQTMVATLLGVVDERITWSNLAIISKGRSSRCVMESNSASYLGSLFGSWNWQLSYLMYVGQVCF